MAQIKSLFKRIVLMIVIISIIITFCAAPSSYAKLTIQEGEFYYAGTQKGSYVPTDGIFSWLLNALSELADFLLGIITMGIRMAFVGYTALVEQLLTWALESTAGVNVAGEDVGVSTSNWLDDLSNSTDNVTVQAIVYNMVPALDPNFFNTDYENMYYKTVTDIDETTGARTERQIIVSPTGQELVCSKCKKSVLECCTDWTEGSTEVKCYAPGVDGKPDCGCNGCAACEKYALLKTATDPIIIQLKTLVAVWYYVIRLLATAAMCIVLIVIGIKMAVSTVASDRAVYKRMLVDWLVGIILIFSMHYIMYFAVTLNETLVDIVRNSANSINKVQLMELADTSKDEEETTRRNQELEVNIYEEIRTRAYDPKLTVGLSGMIMYITLVFMAVKYTLVYLKRFLTLAVLTLMAPGLGVSYAMQKALSGKSSSLKSWFSEYLLNLLIQVVHALIYSIFISAALVFSLQNISGVIIALILMNFSLSAEKIFRKIFNLDPGNKGLLGATSTASDKDKLQKNFKTMKGLAMGAKPVANALMFPGKLVAGTAVRAAGAGAAMGVATLLNRGNNSNTVPEDNGTRPVRQEDSGEREETEEGAPIGEGMPKPEDASGEAKAPEVSGATRKRADEDQELRAKGEDVLKEELAQAEREYQADPNNEKKRIAVLDKNRRLKRYREVLGKDNYAVATRDVVAGHIRGAFDIDNYFDFKFDENGNIIKSTPKKGLVFGTLQYNSTKGKFEVNRSNRAGTHFSTSKLLGFSDQDKKIFKEQVMAPSLQSLGGMVSMFVGMGNLVAHPLEGMTAMTIGFGATSNMLRKFKKPKKGAPGRFKFNRFTTPTVRHISDNVVRQANRELAASISKNVKVKHPTLWQNIKNGKTVAKTIIPAGIGVAGIALGAPALGGATAVLFNRTATHAYNIKDRVTTKKGKSEYKNVYDPYGVDAELSELNPYPTGATAYDVIDMQHYKQIKEQLKDFQDDAETLVSESEVRDAALTVEKNSQKIDSALEKEIREDKELQDQILVQYWLARGYEYDTRTGTTTRIQEVQRSDINPKFEIKDSTSSAQGTVQIRKITQRDISKINKAMDEVIASKINGEELDINSEQTMDEIYKDLSHKLQDEGILDKTQSVKAIFAAGRIQRLIKDKAETANSIVRTEIAEKLELNTDELNAVQQAVVEVAKESADSDGKVDLAGLDQEKVFAKVQEKLRTQDPTSPRNSDRRDGASTHESSSDSRDVTSALDRLNQNANERRYKSAISTILSEQTTPDLVIDTNKQDMLKDVLLSQTGVDVIQIRDRISSSKEGLSRGSESKAPMVTVRELRKHRKKDIAKVIETFSASEVPVTDEQGKIKRNSDGQVIKQPMTREEKVKQAEAALLQLGLDDKSSARDAAIDSLLAISNMQDNLEGLNLHAESTLASTSKFRKKPKKAYMTAILELSAARQESYGAKMEEIKATTTDAKKNAREKIEALDKKVKKAEKKIATVGPVQDVNTATKDVLKSIKQGY